MASDSRLVYMKSIKDTFRNRRMEDINSWLDYLKGRFEETADAMEKFILNEYSIMEEDNAPIVLLTYRLEPTGFQAGEEIPFLEEARFEIDSGLLAKYLYPRRQFLMSCKSIVSIQLSCPSSNCMDASHLSLRVVTVGSVPTLEVVWSLQKLE